MDLRIPDVTTPSPSTPRPRRRWLQFSLRTLLVVMLVLGCGLAWFAREVEREWAQREAAVTIRKMGGRVEYVAVSGGMIPTAVAWLGGLIDHDLSGYVASVSLKGTRVSDAGLVHLQRLTQLVELNLDNTQVSDAGLVHLQGLTQLRWLSLHETRVSDAGVAELHKTLRNCTIDR